MKKITKREFLKKIGLGGAALAGGGLIADEYKPDMSKLPKGSCGDPMNPWFGKNIFPLENTMTDGPSCYIKDGKVIEPAKELPIFHTTDVVVVGGGPAGFAAALAAKKTGAKVTLVERYGSLGGLFTNGMVLIMLATCRRNPGGAWELVTRGVCEDFMNRVGKFGKTFSSQPKNTCPKWHWLPTVDPECAKFVMDEMIAEAGVDMFFHAWGIDVIQAGNKVQGVVFESKEGRQAILAKQVVDCSGDADMLFKAGGEYSQVTAPISNVFRWANMNEINPPKDSTAKFPKRGNEGNPDAMWGGGTHMRGNGLSIRDLTRIEIAQRKENWNKVQKMRATPGWEKVYTSNSSSQLGVRQSRLVGAEFIIGRKEIAEGLNFNDVIGWCGKDGPHAAFPICYRQILPRKIDNLLCAGRCLGKGDTIDTFRLICPCFVTGEAAGAAAGLAALKGCTPRELDYGVLKKQLEKTNVCLS